MNARTIRRAIERKQARKAQKEQPHTEKSTGMTAAVSEACAHVEHAELPAAAKSISDAQLAANRRNAALSTGPVSIEGKDRSSRNALKTGLTGRTVLLATEDATRYEQHLQSYFLQLEPVGNRETELVQSIAGTSWRIARIPGLELGIYALGRIQFEDEFQSLPEAEAAPLIEAAIFVAFQKQLSNLSVQESRLRRHSEKDTAELNRLQELRAAADQKTVPATALPEPDVPTIHPAATKNGFEFSPPAALASLDGFDEDFGFNSALPGYSEAA